MRDRFGPLPVQARDLLYAAHIRLLALKGGVESLCSEDHHIVLRVGEAKQAKLQLLAAVYGSRLQFRGNQIHLDLARLSDKWRDLLPEILVKLGK